MVRQGQFKASYTLDGKANELVVEVKLIEREGLVPPGKNIYYGVATVNGSPYEDPYLEYCVNAQYYAEGIGMKLIEEYKVKAKAENKSFRVKRK